MVEKSFRKDPEDLFRRGGLCISVVLRDYLKG